MGFDNLVTLVGCLTVTDFMSPLFFKYKFSKIFLLPFPILKICIIIYWKNGKVNFYSLRKIKTIKKLLKNLIYNEEILSCI